MDLSSHRVVGEIRPVAMAVFGGCEVEDVRASGTVRIRLAVEPIIQIGTGGSVGKQPPGQTLQGVVSLDRFLMLLCRSIHTSDTDEIVSGETILRVKRKRQRVAPLSFD